jgi:hypothetical protein
MTTPETTTRITLTLDVANDGTATIVRPDGQNWPAPFRFQFWGRERLETRAPTWAPAMVTLRTEHALDMALGPDADPRNLPDALAVLGLPAPMPEQRRVTVDEIMAAVRQFARSDERALRYAVEKAIGVGK